MRSARDRLDDCRVTHGDELGLLEAHIGKGLQIPSAVLPPLVAAVDLLAFLLPGTSPPDGTILTGLRNTDNPRAVLHSGLHDFTNG